MNAAAMYHYTPLPLRYNTQRGREREVEERSVVIQIKCQLFRTIVVCPAGNRLSVSTPRVIQVEMNRCFGTTIQLIIYQLFIFRRKL